MTEIILEPYNKITIRSYLRHESPEAFIDAITVSIRGASGRIGGLFWAKGILFRHFPYIQSDSIAKEYLNGHLPIDHIEFTAMPEYNNEIRRGEITVTIGNVSNHSTLSVLAQWIATNLLHTT